MGWWVVRGESLESTRNNLRTQIAFACQSSGVEADMGAEKAKGGRGARAKG